MKQSDIIETVEDLKKSIFELNQILYDLHKMGVDVIISTKHPYDTKEGLEFEIKKITQTLDYLKNE